MQSSVTYLNGYTELQVTPGLRPMTAYNLNGSYILKQKYIFNLFVMYTSDYFAQAPYQSSERLALIYKNTNWNFMRMWGANVIGRELVRYPLYGGKNANLSTLR